VDGSEHSLAATEFIRDLPLSAGSEVTALAVLTPRFADTPGRAALLEALNKVRAILQGTVASVNTGLLHGYPAEELTRFADEHRPDLIGIGAKGLHATFGILLGGVAQQIVEYASSPVLVVRAPYTGLWRVLLVTDGSVYSQRAVAYLAQFPFPETAEVRVMHVLPPLPPVRFFAPIRPLGVEVVPPEAYSEVYKAMVQQAEREEQMGQAILAEAKERLRTSGVEAATVLVRGDTAAEIIEYIRTHKVDLVVAGSRGLSQVKGWLLGSLSRKLVHYAGCSVLIVKGGSEST
jgi:nucleotide-binding universal stress UspA family protein